MKIVYNILSVVFVIIASSHQAKEDTYGFLMALILSALFVLIAVVIELKEELKNCE